MNNELTDREILSMATKDAEYSKNIDNITMFGHVSPWQDWYDKHYSHRVKRLVVVEICKSYKERGGYDIRIHIGISGIYDGEWVALLTHSSALFDSIFAITDLSDAQKIAQAIVNSELAY